jgi:hypothetical protein
MLAGGMSDRRQAAFGGQLVIGGEASAIVTEFGKDLRRIDGAAARQALQEPAIRMLRQGGFDGGRQLLDLGAERIQDGHERADDVAARLRFRLTDLACRRRAEAGEQLGHGAAAAVRVLAEELRETLLAEAHRAVRRGVAGEEGERDGRVDVGEDRSRPGPEALEERAQLIGEGDTLGDEVVAAAHERAQGARIVGGRTQRPEPVAVGPEHIGEDERVAGIALAAGGRVAGPTRFERVRVNRYDLEPSVDESVDEQARGTFEGNAYRPPPAQAAQAGAELREPGAGVGHRALPAAAPGLVDDADRVGLSRPVDAYEELHCVASGDGETLRGERSGRSLTDWRSGLPGHVARHPVAGLGLSSFGSRERVSCWPLSGERTWLSPNADRLAPLSSLSPRRTSDFRERVVQ